MKKYWGWIILSATLMLLMTTCYNCNKSRTVHVKLLSSYREVTDLNRNYNGNPVRAYLAENMDNGKNLYLACTVYDPPFKEGDLLKVRIKKLRFIPKEEMFSYQLRSKPSMFKNREGKTFFNLKIKVWKIMEAEAALVEKEEK